MKVWNRRDSNVPADAVYVGRPTKWGNPFVVDRDGTREEVIAEYREWLLHNMHSPVQDGRELEELRGKDLVCWCAPKACHADVLMEVANK